MSSISMLASMKPETSVEMVFWILGGLGVFLLGMRHLSDGLQAIAGDRLRTMIGAVTNNRLMATGVGTGVTCVVQSSSITTVMVVGFVNAGFMTLRQSIGVIMGANIGTTITGWILVLKIGKYGLPVLGLAALVYLFAKKDRLRYMALAAMGIGMVFFGLQLMKGGFAPIKDMPEFEKWFQKFDAHSYWGVMKCVLAGCVLTMIVQSSSATLGITIGLVSTGVIPFQTGAALVLGENIGTTITALLASLGTNTNAKRAAYAHVFFNIVGVLWITSLFLWLYMPAVEQFVHWCGRDPAATAVKDGKTVFANAEFFIASTHTGFNVINTLLFLPFVGVLANALMRLVPDKAFKEVPHLTQLDSRMGQAPAIALEQSRLEVVRMSETLQKMFTGLRVVLDEDRTDAKDTREIFHKEEVLDVVQKEVTVFVSELLGGQIPHELAEEGPRIIRMADEYESQSDYATNLLKLYLRLRQEKLNLQETQKAELLQLHDRVVAYSRMIDQAVADNQPEVLIQARTEGDGITFQIRELRKHYLSGAAESLGDPMVTMIFTDMLNAYRRVKDHALNVAEALAGEK